jgi:glycosyltransferase involved in cell wall biosynthesis
MKTTLIITTYNWASALDAVLTTVSDQTRLPEEVIVADDGSSPETRELIDKWLPRLGCVLIHVWQADAGFRAARARNLAITKASGDHLIFVDGDCLLPPHFVENHRRLTRPGSLISGGRVLLTGDQTDTLLSNHAESYSEVFTGPKHLSLWWLPLRNRVPLSWRAVRTCNISILTQDVLAVEGFDEAYTGWGKEDSDLAVRLEKFGVKFVSGRFAACVSHLFHKEQPRTALEANEVALAEVVTASSWKPKKSCLRSIYYEG